MFHRHRLPGIAAAARPAARLAALATAVITVLGAALALILVPVAAHAATAAAPPYWADSPFNVPGGTGASVPFTEYARRRARVRPGS